MSTSRQSARHRLQHRRMQQSQAYNATAEDLAKQAPTLISREDAHRASLAPEERRARKSRDSLSPAPAPRSGEARRVSFAPEDRKPRTSLDAQSPAAQFPWTTPTAAAAKAESESVAAPQFPSSTVASSDPAKVHPSVPLVIKGSPSSPSAERTHRVPATDSMLPPAGSRSSKESNIRSVSSPGMAETKIHVAQDYSAVPGSKPRSLGRDVRIVVPDGGNNELGLRLREGAWPPEVHFVEPRYRAFWEEQHGVQEGDQILEVNDLPIGHSRLAHVIPLLAQRPLALTFRRGILNYLAHARDHLYGNARPEISSPTGGYDPFSARMGESLISKSAGKQASKSPPYAAHVQENRQTNESASRWPAPCSKHMEGDLSQTQASSSPQWPAKSSKRQEVNSEPMATAVPFQVQDASLSPNSTANSDTRFAKGARSESHGYRNPMRQVFTADKATDGCISVKIQDNASLGLEFDDEAYPPKVVKVGPARADVWSRIGVRPGDELLMVNDISVAKMRWPSVSTAGLLDHRPVTLSFRRPPAPSVPQHEKIMPPQVTTQLANQVMMDSLLQRAEVAVQAVEAVRRQEEETLRNSAQNALLEQNAAQQMELAAEQALLEKKAWQQMELAAEAEEFRRKCEQRQEEMVEQTARALTGRKLQQEQEQARRDEWQRTVAAQQAEDRQRMWISEHEVAASVRAEQAAEEAAARAAEKVLRQRLLTAVAAKEQEEARIASYEMIAELAAERQEINVAQELEKQFGKLRGEFAEEQAAHAKTLQLERERYEEQAKVLQRERELQNEMAESRLRQQEEVLEQERQRHSEQADALLRQQEEVLKRERDHLIRQQEEVLEAEKERRSQLESAMLRQREEMIAEREAALAELRRRPSGQEDTLQSSALLLGMQQMQQSNLMQQSGMIQLQQNHAALVQALGGGLAPLATATSSSALSPSVGLHAGTPGLLQPSPGLVQSSTGPDSQPAARQRAATGPGSAVQPGEGPGSLRHIVEDEAPLGLIFVKRSRPPQVGSIQARRLDYWKGLGLKIKDVLIAVNDTSVAHMSAEEVLGLLSARPLQLDFGKLEDLADAAGQEEQQDQEDQQQREQLQSVVNAMNPVNNVDEQGQTLLHRAADSGDERACLEVLDMPEFTAINVKDLLGKTALHYAAHNNLPHVCNAISDRHDFVALHARDWSGATALDLAIEEEHDEVVEVLASPVADPLWDHPGW
eukprot:gnl/TRDRNA2_/TRDRNA2_168427_c2_seq1.p1 gnl/TRDRNA2_/TRDRNA2_168427_c2~~gnl/TRDRNA2_/TRDRNA2_168427_c2_seq1.p1  ORF type:complete len:1212 (-),score=274.15 gnl/TRDRNA2_/TRDRNA2_168427_c2_seq1:114-3749(-)